MDPLAKTSSQLEADNLMLIMNEPRVNSNSKLGLVRAYNPTVALSKVLVAVVLLICILCAPIVILWSHSHSIAASPISVYSDIPDIGQETVFPRDDVRKRGPANEGTNHTTTKSTYSSPSNESPVLLVSNNARTLDPTLSSANITNATMNQIINAVVSTLNPCALQCLGLPTSQNITATQWTQICGVVNNTFASNTSDLVSSEQGLNFNNGISSADLGKVVNAGQGLFASTMSIDAAQALAVAEAKALCEKTLSCGTLVQKGVMALQAVCSTMSPNGGLNVTPSFIASLLGIIGPFVVPSSSPIAVNTPVPGPRASADAARSGSMKSSLHWYSFLIHFLLLA
ncbi:hypothetical protein BCR33DRAFT_765185 [Rhizoclosmatium globosum]|uniref:Uncharacterized protein n=1 Tax=Rhizoclosmatium globosum TaxID=329046 RepID=A0A1Y2CFX2_9FUNG|nr:hypothetical protein BCR33DRAFT_765185 [Rhizoclosmatium globosum]|eukprot:ORY45958.1 hypothetical protein BCR33DRAFT_765185 [Rhizoclosmatium globosum]